MGLAGLFGIPTFYKDNPTSTTKQIDLFSSWADRNLDPRKAKEAVSCFKLAANCSLYAALDQLSDANSMQEFVDSSSTKFKLYKYSTNIDVAMKAINAGQSATIDFDSSVMEVNVKSAFGKASMGGRYGIFSANVSGEYEQMNAVAAQEGFKINGKINKFATISVNPISWFNDGEFSRAYKAKNDNTIWDPNANSGDWDTYFNETDGSLAWRVSQLLLVSDYEITVTSNAKYSQNDFQKIKADASVSVWPFFSASASATHSSEYSLNSEGNLVVKHTLNKGLIEIWGAIVKKAPL